MTKNPDAKVQKFSKNEKNYIQGYSKMSITKLDLNLLNTKLNANIQTYRDETNLRTNVIFT
jgi:hypothetical protein